MLLGRCSRHVYSLADDKAIQITDGLSDAKYPAFDKEASTSTSVSSRRTATNEPYTAWSA
jgi:hypothetical protein